VKIQVLTAESMNFRCDIALMMEAIRTSKTSVNIYVTRRQYISEDSKVKIVESSNFEASCDFHYSTYTKRLRAHLLHVTHASQFASCKLSLNDAAGLISIDKSQANKE
jgi:hypothetical protein